MRLRHLIFVVNILAANYVSAEVVDCAYVPASTFAVREWPPAGGLPDDDATYFYSPTTIHQLKSGSETALVFRKFIPGRSGELDADRFFKVTILLANSWSNDYSAVVTSELARASRGGSAWLVNGSGFVSTSVRGTIGVNKSGDVLRAKVDVSFDMEFVAEPIRREKLNFSGDFRLMPLAVDELTPWMGGITDATDLRATTRLGELKYKIEGQCASF